ncbi:hypothetical protein [Ureibacillus sinduriensis]|uniref:Uncharacterized protein n=1 Tax=Ureibacillus sinduriensis BLB-1 = JCM 15800 TaxID=1384057 RepID=A0A0A3HVT4_9BACL|nr:hypothetical protein [Ureibacillus sinduriensis]KGR74423.1 hypothetical protein CD33_15095 [Ureibacillus sinduriensis BLB-1 = JCM 15800]
MQKINWDMMTQFVFPEQLGLVEEVVSVDIKPIWQQIETEDSVRLVGIYHIAAVARFNPDELPEYSDGTLIEELEFEGNNGYFEYALPLEIDLPRDKVAYDCTPDISVNDVAHFVYDGSNCTFKWDVDCQFSEVVEGGLFQFEQQSPIEFDQVPLPEKPVIEEVVSVHEEGAEESHLQGVASEFEAISEEPANEQVDAPPIEVAPSYEDFQSQEETTETEEIHFGGTDGIFPEETSFTEGQPPIEEVNEEEDAITLEDALGKADESPSLKAEPSSYDVSDATLVESIAEQKVEEPKLEKIDKEKVVEARNQYFPTDTDDFYNELTESYTILNVSNKSYRE